MNPSASKVVPTRWKPSAHQNAVIVLATKIMQLVCHRFASLEVEPDGMSVATRELGAYGADLLNNSRRKSDCELKRIC
jgi:hypothetical protein